MNFFAGLALTIFIISGILMILVVLVQDDQGEGLGGLFSGSNANSFSGQSFSFLQKVTGMLALLFFVSAISYGLAKRGLKTIDLPINTEFNTETTSPWWATDNQNPAQDNPDLTE